MTPRRNTNSEKSHGRGGAGLELAQAIALVSGVDA